MISNINNNYKSYSIYNDISNTHKNLNLSFKGNVSIHDKKLFAIAEDILSSFAIVKRFINNKILNYGKKERLKKFYFKLLSIDINSSKYIKILHNYARKYAKNKEVEINLESNRLLDIVNSDEACIFIMNHDDGKKDPSLLGVLYTLLTGAYLNLGKAANCPRPKIIVNNDILTAMNEKHKMIYKLLGAVGINAKLFSTTKGENSQVMKDLIKNFNENKNHIFIFPEGKLGMFKDLDLKDKFQPGVGGIVNKASQKKKRVKVVPIGFAYNYETRNFLGSIYIGEPVYFMRQKEQMLVNRSNIDLTSTEDYKKFFNLDIEDWDSFKTITHQGIPVSGRDLNCYIAGILCENLRMCRNKAEKQLPKIALDEMSIMI